MQALKKIFDEIDARTIEFEAFGITDDYVSTEWIKEIIRQHINNVQSNTVTEYCPHCEKEVEICWDVEEDGYQIFCSYGDMVLIICVLKDYLKLIANKEGPTWDYYRDKFSKMAYRLSGQIGYNYEKAYSLEQNHAIK